jgi:hypothetical protein
MPAVFFDTNALYIKGYRDSFTAGSLVADVTSIGVGVRVLHGTDYLVNDAWQNYTREDESGFASADELMAYLTAEFAKRRPLAPVPRGPGVFVGPGNPTADLGLAGDLYIDAISGDLFSKET